MGWELDKFFFGCAFDPVDGFTPAVCDSEHVAVDDTPLAGTRVDEEVACRGDVERGHVRTQAMSYCTHDILQEGGRDLRPSRLG